MADKERLAALIKEFGLTQVEVSQSLHVNERTLRRWLSGETSMPPWIPGILCLFYGDEERAIKLLLNIRGTSRYDEDG